MQWDDCPPHQWLQRHRIFNKTLFRPFQWAPDGLIILTASEIPIEKLTDFCYSLASELMKDHEKRFGERIRTVKEASNALANSASRFGTSVKNAWGTMDETATEYGTRLAQTIQENANQVNQTEASPKFSNAESFHEESVQALNKIILTVRRYVPKLHRGLKAETAALNTALVKLETSIRALGAALDDSPGSKIEVLNKDAELLKRRQAELLDLKTEKDERASALETVSGREKELMREEQELTSQGEFLELKRYEESLRSKEDEIKQFFQPIAKPLLKLERAASAKQDTAIDDRTLRGLVEEPVQTLASGQTFSIVQLLGQLEEALGHGQLDVEERKRRRAQETIQHARNGAIGAMRDEHLAIQANIQETLRQLRANGLIEKRDRLGQRMADVRHEKENLSARHKDLERRIDDMSRDVVKQKTALESRISKLSHRTVTILAG